MPISRGNIRIQANSAFPICASSSSKTTRRLYFRSARLLEPCHSYQRCRDRRHHHERRRSGYGFTIVISTTGIFVEVAIL